MMRAPRHVLRSLHPRCAAPFCPRAAAVALCLAFTSACTLGPDYKRPEADTPAAWQTDPGWRLAAPSHAPIALDWWRIFDDPLLDTLEARALAQNQTLAAASAHYAQATATLAAVSSQRLPELDLDASVARAKVSKKRPQLNYATPNQSTVQNQIAIGPSLTYDIDLFGRIRREVESASASAEQARDDLANARLVLSSDLATAYYALRERDAEIDVLDRSVQLQEKALDYVKAKHELGAVSGLDLLQQQSQLDSTRVQATLLRQQRAQYEHAIAALTGTPAPGFSIAPQLVPMTVPAIATGLPSELLERRPDVAAAERAMAAANAQIGAAKAAFFPDLTLSPSIGWESTGFANLLSAPSLMWTVGSALKQTLFDGGQRKANLAFANEGYRAAVANYRQAVLSAFAQVQDGVTGLAVLARAASQSQAAVDDAKRLLSLANDRYSGGLVAYLDVISAQQSLLTSERQDAQVRGQRISLAVSLVKALGGGWQARAPAETNAVAQR